MTVVRIKTGMMTVLEADWEIFELYTREQSLIGLGGTDTVLDTVESFSGK